MQFIVARFLNSYITKYNLFIFFQQLQFMQKKVYNDTQLFKIQNKFKHHNEIVYRVFHE